MADRNADIGLIVNPRARKVKKRFLPGNRFWEGLVPDERTWITDDFEELESALKQAREKGMARLALLGGDGTHHLCLTFLVRTWTPPYPEIIPLPGGTMNALCKNLGIKAAPREILQSVVSGGTGCTVTKNLIRVSHSGLDRYGFTFANGIIYNAFADYYRAPDPGVTDAVRATVVSLASGLLAKDSPANRLRPVNARVRADGEIVADGNVRVITASTLDNPVLWFKPFPYELNGLPAFHCVINRMDAKDIIMNAWSLMRGKARHPAHFIGELSRLEIQTDQGYILDGEIYEVKGPETINVTVGPAMKFMGPAAREIAP